MWVRGLKLSIVCNIGKSFLSHPMWVRGLKHQRNTTYAIETFVAPYVGAWIETTSNTS